MTAESIARWSAGMVAVVGAAYIVVLGIGISSAGSSRPIGDPVLAVMEILTVCSALPMVGLMAAILADAPPARRLLSLLALVFTSLFAGITSVVHFVGLTAERQLGRGTIVWPSPAYAAELLAWDLFLGIALVLCGLGFDAGGPQRGVRRWLLGAGVLCLLGTIGPVVGDMRLQRIGVVGYGVVLPVACVLLVRQYRAGQRRR